MNISQKYKVIEAMNNTKLPKKYRQKAEAIPIDDWIDINNSWVKGDRDLYNRVLNKYQPCGNDKGYYLLAIWFHPLTKFQDLAIKVDNLINK